MAEDTTVTEPAVQGDQATGNTESSPVAFTLEDGTAVTVDEARNGYLRQQDYTRKTQEVATVRKDNEADLALAQWINENPVEAVDWLNEQVKSLRQADNSSDEEPDPVRQELDELRGFVDEQRQSEQRRAAEAEIARLGREYGEFDAGDLLAHAVEKNIPDLEVALIHMNAVNAKSRDADEARRREAAKENLPDHLGRNAEGSSPTTKKNPSVSEALAETMRELGIDRLPPVE